MTRIYLDHAATTPIAPAARAAMANALETWANPSSPHREGRTARAALENARERIGAALGWEHALVFTSGVTDAAAIALGRGTRPVIVSAVEHAAVLGARTDAIVAPVREDGIVDIDALQGLLAGHPGAIVAIQHVNSETGVIQPVDAVQALVAAAGGVLFCDAAQSGGKLALPAADMVAVSAHKLGGPPGIGALLVRDLGLLSPWGQGQERGYRPGTENLPAVLGFAAALEGGSGTEEHAAWRTMLEEALRAEGASVIAGLTPRSPLIGAYAMPGMSAAAQLMRLDALGFAVSAGSACSSGSMRPSHVLAAMRVPEDVAARTIRVSFGWSTTEDEVHRFIAAWIALAREARRRAA